MIPCVESPNHESKRSPWIVFFLDLQNISRWQSLVSHQIRPMNVSLSFLLSFHSACSWLDRFVSLSFSLSRYPQRILPSYVCMAFLSINDTILAPSFPAALVTHCFAVSLPARSHDHIDLRHSRLMNDIRQWHTPRVAVNCPLACWEPSQLGFSVSLRCRTIGQWLQHQRISSLHFRGLNRYVLSFLFFFLPLVFVLHVSSSCWPRWISFARHANKKKTQRGTTSAHRMLTQFVSSLLSLDHLSWRWGVSFAWARID